MTIQTSIDFTSQSLRDDGLQRAVEHADRTSYLWSGLAWSWFELFIDGLPKGYTFQIEDFRAYAKDRGLEEPPSKRAFGFIPNKAVKAGLIEFNGTAKVDNPKAHKAISNVWKKI